MADTRGFTRQDLEAIYSSESRRVFASLVRLLGDFDLAEEALQDAFIAALELWPGAGIPANARAWLISVGRFRAIDRLRRRARFDKAHANIMDVLYAQPQVDTEADNGVADDRLGLIFICCHPAISADAQVALTLREVCGLTTEEIARAFLTAPATIAQRVVRAKLKIREAHIPFETPPLRDITGKLAAVLRVIYLVFSEGYWASAGAFVTRCDLSAEAIRLARLLAELLPEPEVKGLLALMLFHESRRTARVSTGGKPVLMAEQNRSLWDQCMIGEAATLLEAALSSRKFGSYTLQAAIAGLHAQAQIASDTDWTEIVGLYDVLLRTEPSPLIELNRAVAVAMREGPAAGLALIDAILARGDLCDYHLAHSARAELCRRLNRAGDARVSYAKALELAQQEPEREFLAHRLGEVPDP